MRQSWVKELHNLGPENIVIVLVGNKCDLESERVSRHCPGLDPVCCMCVCVAVCVAVCVRVSVSVCV